MAEEEGFEPPELSLNGFQDRRLKPLGHSSPSGNAQRRPPSQAEREGFEPPVPVKAHRISSAAQSTRLCHLSTVGVGFEPTVPR